MTSLLSYSFRIASHFSASLGLGFLARSYPFESGLRNNLTLKPKGPDERQIGPCSSAVKPPCLRRSFGLIRDLSPFRELSLHQAPVFLGGMIRSPSF